MSLAEFVLLMVDNPPHRGTDDPANVTIYMRMQLQQFQITAVFTAGSRKGAAVSQQIKMAAGWKKAQKAQLEQATTEQPAKLLHKVSLAGGSDIEGMASFGELVPAAVFATARQ